MTRTVSLTVFCAAALAAGGCAMLPGRPSSDGAAPAKAKVVGPGMNEAGQVVDSSKVEAGYGQKVKGLDDREGEITGKPAPGSKFIRLQIGMSMNQVIDLIGRPTDQGAYVTSRAWIPWHFGSDSQRFEWVYRNQGRLVFAGGSLNDFTGGKLIWIIHNATEGGYR